MINPNAQDFLAKCDKDITNFKSKIDSRKQDAFLLPGTMRYLHNLYGLDPKEAQVQIDYFINGDQD